MPREIKPPPSVIQCPFKITVCSNETAPYYFRNISRTVTYRGQKIKVPLEVEVVRKALWAFNMVDIEIKVGKTSQKYRTGLADYGIEGHEMSCAIERKSIDDLFQTLGGRRSKFEAEIKRMNRDCRVSYLLIEADLPQISVYDGVDSIVETLPVVKQDKSPNPFQDLFASSPSPRFTPEGDLIENGKSEDGEHFDELEFSTSLHSKGSSKDASKNSSNTRSQSAGFKSHGVSASTVIGTWKSWTQKYPKVQWVFASNRSMAERMCFELLAEHWQKLQENYWD